MMRVAGGFLDLQINGGWGHHFSESPESIWDVGEQLVAHGVTAFLPTLVSDGYERLDDALDVLAAGPPSGWRGAEPIGLHLEGPWLAADRRGAHSQNAIQAPDLASLPDRLRASAGVALVTIAPEIAGAGPVIRELRDRGVAVSCGHSAASLDEALADHAANELEILSPLDDTQRADLVDLLRVLHHAISDGPLPDSEVAAADG